MEFRKESGGGAGVLHRSQSLCPLCKKPVPAVYREENGRVFFVKECPDHGTFKTIAAEDAELYKSWTARPVVNIPPKRAQTEGDPRDLECPLHCGVCENHLQTACCVLIDITDRCNQRCPYCFAKAEKDADRSGEPSLQELERKFDLLLELGEERPFNIQLSGGEPTVREDLPRIIALARDKGFEYVQINTNGRKLATEAGYAEELKAAGASVIFMQFDGTRDDIYRRLRGEPLLALKKRAVENCEAAGLPVTLVPTVVQGVNDDNLGNMLDFVVRHVNVVKGIHFQPVSFFGRHPEQVEPGDSPGAGAPWDSGDSQPVVPREDLSEAAPEGGPRPVYSGDFPGRITMFDLLEKLSAQRPAIRYEDFCPISTGHTLCCFYSTYAREPDGSIRCMLAGEEKEAGVSCCDAAGGTGCCDSSGDCGEPAQPPQAIGCCDVRSPEALDVIKKDRDFVLNRWEIGPSAGTPAGMETERACGGERRREDEEPGCDEFPPAEDGLMDMDQFLRYYRQNTFTVTGMAFQDAMNLDAERLKRCRVQVLSEDDRLIPFCAYNTLYRK